MEIVIKKFEELSTKELYMILKLRAEIFVVEQNCIYNDLDDKDFESFHIFILEKENIIAYERIVKPGISYKEYSIGRVAVTKEVRRKGLARTLLQKGINFIKNEMKENTIRISAQKYLLNFYQSMGFAATSEEYLEDGIPHIEMLLK